MGGKVSRTLEEAHREQRPNLNLKALALNSFPPIIYKLRNLKVLQLSGNRLSSVPPELGMLGHLQVLELDTNLLTALHGDICNLRSLTELTLFFNKLKELPSQIGKLGSLTKLIVEKNELTSIPYDIGRLVSLQTLHAGDNQIAKLPESFGDLESLTMLSLACNALTHLPTTFGKLTALNKLNLRTNMLTCLSPKFYALTHLTTLALWSNKFTEFPSDITRLTNLTDLSIHQNKLTAIPDAIGKLVKLQKLYLQHNELENLPSNLRYLTALNVLLLQDNKLNSIPCEIGFLPIQHINLDKNPLPDFIHAYLQKSHTNLQTYLQNEFELKQQRSVIVLQRWYRLHLKTRRFTSIVKLIVDTNKQAKLVEQFQMDLKKKQTIVKLQRHVRSWQRRKMWRAVVTGAHSAELRRGSVSTVLPPSTSIYIFTDEQIKEINFGEEPDSAETITWYNPDEDLASSRRSLRISSPDTVIMSSATIFKLIEHMTSGYSESPDFCETILFTLETFTTPSCFLDLIMKRYGDATTAGDKSIQLKVIEIIQTLIKNHFYYVENFPIFATNLQNFINTTLSVEHQELVSNLGADLEARRQDTGLRTMHGVTDLVEFLSTAPLTHPIPRDISPKNLHLCLDVNPEEIARQMTLIDQALLHRITPLELLNQRWTRTGKEKNAPNVLAMIERFNQVAQWIATEICTEESLKLRITKIKRFVDIGMKCLELNNFNGVMQVVTALNSSAVARLKTTWANVSARRKEGFAAMEKLMDMYSNYKAYRDLLASTPPPCIPFLALFLSDLTFIDDGNPNFANTNQLNITKRRLTAEVVRTLSRSRSIPYRLLPVSLIQEKLMTGEALDDMTLYKHSLKLERKNTGHGTLRKSIASALPGLMRSSSQG